MEETVCLFGIHATFFLGRLTFTGSDFYHLQLPIQLQSISKKNHLAESKWKKNFLSFLQAMLMAITY